MALDFSKLQADVEAQTTVIGSAKTAFQALAAEIDALKQHVGDDPAAQAAIDALAAKVEAQSADLAAAVAANTPAG